MQYCSKHNVELSSSKTKLQVYTPSNLSVPQVNLLKNSAQLQIDGSSIEFVDMAEHVGVIRSIDGNLPHILNRMTSHNRALHGILSAGLARGHRGNPAASLRAEKIYGLPVFLSGTSALNLKPSEISILNQHYKNKLQNLQKLHDKTPDSVVYFLAGSLPAEALLHLRQLSLFSMICRLPDNVLNRIARYILITANENGSSWFVSIVKLCSLYGLPHPLTLLDNPVPKIQSKKLFKSKVLDYWQTHLRISSSGLDSLLYFKPEYMSLNEAHPIWSTCGNNSYEVNKAIIQARFLSGRYRCEKLTRHFSPGSSPICTICDDESIGSIEHILTSCGALTDIRSKHLQTLESIKISNQSKAIIQT